MKPPFQPLTIHETLARHAPSEAKHAIIATEDFYSLHGGARIQAAVNALPLSGGVVTIAPGIYELEETLYLGNGAFNQWSTRQGILLRGSAPPNDSPWTSSVALRWAIASAVPMIAVMGPIVGWGVENLHIDGAGKASAALYVQSAQMGNCTNLIMQGCQYYGIQSTTVPAFDGRNTDSLHNHWHNIRIWHLAPALQPHGAGISLDTGSNDSNTCLNTFTNTMVIVSGAPALGLRLGGCDTNFFLGAHVYAADDTLGSIAFDFGNAGSNFWPCNNQFFGMTYGPNEKVQYYGTPHPDTCGNNFWGWTQQGDMQNPLPYAPTLTTLTTDIRNQDLVIIPGSNPAYSAEAHGNLRLHTSREAPHHFVPSASNLSDLGSPTQTFRNVHLSGGLMRPIRLVSGTTWLTTQDYYVEIDTTASDRSVLLPDAAIVRGREFVLTKTGGNDISVIPVGTQTINGQPYYLFGETQQSATLISTGIGWRTIGRA